MRVVRGAQEHEARVWFEEVAIRALPSLDWDKPRGLSICIGFRKCSGAASLLVAVVAMAAVSP